MKTLVVRGIVVVILVFVTGCQTVTAAPTTTTGLTESVQTFIADWARQILAATLL